MGFIIEGCCVQMPGVRRPAECPACTLEAKRRRLAEGGSDDSDYEDVMDAEEKEQGTQEEK